MHSRNIKTNDVSRRRRRLSSRGVPGTNATAWAARATLRSDADAVAGRLRVAAPVRHRPRKSEHASRPRYESRSTDPRTAIQARAELLLQLRIALTRLDNEARDKMEAEARKELRPPFDMRLSTARNELTNLMPLLDRPPLSQLPKWQAFRRDLVAYVETTKDADNYSLNGFAKFQAVDRELNELIRTTGLSKDRYSTEVNSSRTRPSARSRFGQLSRFWRVYL